jgi:hypothetical protein
MIQKFKTRESRRLHAAPAGNDSPHLRGMTARHELRCLQNTFALRMYSILNKAIEGLPALRTGADSRSKHAAVFNPDAEQESNRLDNHSPAVTLTESKASWAGCDAFEVRWTSLAA